jgi:hypothetical protein
MKGFSGFSKSGFEGFVFYPSEKYVFGRGAKQSILGRVARAAETLKKVDRYNTFGLTSCQTASKAASIIEDLYTYSIPRLL